MGDTDPDVVVTEPAPAPQLVREVGAGGRHPRVVLCIVAATLAAMAAAVPLTLAMRTQHRACPHHRHRDHAQPSHRWTQHSFGELGEADLAEPARAK